MADTFAFRLVTPTGVVFDGRVEMATAVGPLGEFGVLPNHINFVSSLTPGILTLRIEDATYRDYVVWGGLAEVKDGKMTVLASGAQVAEELQPSEAQREVDAAEQRLRHLSFYEMEYADAVRALQLAMARTRAAEIRRP